MNRKGFTLIELLATITILAMIMLAAVPNIMSTLDKSKRRTYIEDAKKMISLAEYRLRSDTTVKRPSNGQSVVFLLKSMDLTDFSEGPEGGQYDTNYSYVKLTNSGGTYVYYATLIENYGDNKHRGVVNLTRDQLLNENAINKVSKLNAVPAISTSGVVQTVNELK